MSDFILNIKQIIEWYWLSLIKNRLNIRIILKW